MKPDLYAPEAKARWRDQLDSIVQRRIIPFVMIQSSALSVEVSRYGIRETTEGIKKIIPELCLVGHVSYHTARPSSFFHHQHPKVLEIFYIVRGKVSWWVEGMSTDVRGNELFLIWPNEWHGARDNIVEPAEYFWIQVQLPLLSHGMGGKEFTCLKRDLRRMPHRKLTGTTALLPLYQSLLREHARGEVYGKSVVRETLHLLLSLVLRSSRTQNTVQVAERPYNVQLGRAINWTKAHVADAAVKNMVQASGLDEATFRNQFCALMGVSPAQYLVRLRLQNAKDQLVQGRTITEIAHELGFSSSQYFATVFRKYEGLSPSQFLTRVEKGRGSESQVRDVEHILGARRVPVASHRQPARALK